jgi:hypothetical protein
MKASRSSVAAWLIAGLAVLVLTTNAWASFVLDIQVSDGSGKTSKTLTLQDWGLSCEDLIGEICKHGSWQWVGVMDALADGTGERLGSITELQIGFDQDPYVNLGFSVIAGDKETTFTISSSATAVNLTNPQAYASAGITLTDNPPTAATITGLYTGGKIYEARYNGTSVFADLVSGFGVSGGTDTRSEREPASGRKTIFDTVSTISSEFHFTLSAWDQASGTSSFNAIPEPATVGLLVAGGAVMNFMRRRRA